MAVQVFPFKRDQPNILWTAAGPINYYIGFQDGDWSETYTDGGGESTRMTLYVDWGEAPDFKTYALGFSDAVPLPPSPPPPPPPPPPPGVPPLPSDPSAWAATHRLVRHVPLLCEWTEKQHLDEIVKKKMGGGHEPDPALPDFWPRAGWIAYEATFRSRPYAIVPDDALSSQADRELYRYVTRLRRNSYRERRIPEFALVFVKDSDPTVPDGDGIVPEVGFVPFPVEEYEYVWHKVPCKYVNIAAVHQCVGKVNHAPWDYAGAAGPRLGGPFDTERLMFMGLDRNCMDNPYLMPNNEWAVDLRFSFRFTPEGWNKVPRPDGSWRRVKYRGTAASPMYFTADFNTLFTLRQ